MLQFEHTPQSHQLTSNMYSYIPFNLEFLSTSEVTEVQFENNCLTTQLTTEDGSCLEVQIAKEIYCEDVTNSDSEVLCIIMDIGIDKDVS